MLPPLLLLWLIYSFSPHLLILFLLWNSFPLRSPGNLRVSQDLARLGLAWLGSARLEIAQGWAGDTRLAHATFFPSPSLKLDHLCQDIYFPLWPNFTHNISPHSHVRSWGLTIQSYELNILDLTWEYNFF